MRRWISASSYLLMSNAKTQSKALQDSGLLKLEIELLRKSFGRSLL